MNDKFTNNVEREEDIARKLSQVAEHTRASGQFAADLEERLRSAHKPRTGWLALFDQMSPTLRWVALMVLLALILSLSIKTLIPVPQPAAHNTPVNPAPPTLMPAPDNTLENTPAPQGESFDFRGAKLYMNASLPDSPAQASVYQLLDAQPASAEYAKSLANQFGIDGDVYLTQGQVQGSQAFMVTDGKQQLVVNSETNYTYISDLVTNSHNYNGFKNDNADEAIREFLPGHGFDFKYVLDTSGLFGDYVLTQLAPDGIPMEYEYFSQPVMRITFNEDGSVLSVTASLMKYDSAALGTFGIISADEALQKLLDDAQAAGKLESTHGGGDPTIIAPQTWYYDYPENETVNFYGNISVNPAVDSSQPAMLFIDYVPLIGNTSGMESLENYSFVGATGQFVIENGIRKFKVESLDKNVKQAFMTGTAHREGDNIIITSEDGGNGQYILVNPPSDLPLDFKFPESQLSSTGVVVDGKFYWTSLQFIPDSSKMGGGGGGGGGYGFYQLNLSGTPIPFPTATPMGTVYTPQELASFLRYTVKEGDTVLAIAQMYGITPEKIFEANNLNGGVLMVGTTLVIPGVPGPTHIDGERGTVQVQIYEKPNGTRRTVYSFSSEKDGTYYQLIGNDKDLEPLQQVMNRPIKIWGSVSFDQYGMPSLNMEKFEALYPGLQFEVLNGTQEMKVIDGMDVVLFTTNGTTYAQLVSTGGYPDSNYYPDAGEVQIEVVRVPDETYKGYPAVRVFSFAPAKNPITGDPVEIRRVAEDVSVVPDPFGNGDHYVQPDITIDRVELIYYVSNPMFQQGDNPQANANLRYIQPAWHFRGHYANGDELDVLIQALQQQYLSPELTPHQGPG